MIKIHLDLASTHVILTWPTEKDHAHTVALPTNARGMVQLRNILFHYQKAQSAGRKPSFSTAGMPTQEQINKMASEFELERQEKRAKELDDLGLSLEDLGI